MDVPHPHSKLRLSPLLSQITEHVLPVDLVRPLLVVPFVTHTIHPVSLETPNHSLTLLWPAPLLFLMSLLPHRVIVPILSR